mmetsp:Transcript_67713/g.152146  ORF Transcript_67713/g.152146 Transcript_67713/m.152146 type:complete len:333 (-) Transcript_67713:278-1276(-)
MTAPKSPARSTETNIWRLSPKVANLKSSSIGAAGASSSSSSSRCLSSFSFSSCFPSSFFVLPGAWPNSCSMQSSRPDNNGGAAFATVRRPQMQTPPAVIIISSSAIPRMGSESCTLTGVVGTSTSLTRIGSFPTRLKAARFFATSRPSETEELCSRCRSALPSSPLDGAKANFTSAASTATGVMSIDSNFGCLPACNAIASQTRTLKVASLAGSFKRLRLSTCDMVIEQATLPATSWAFHQANASAWLALPAPQVSPLPPGAGSASARGSGNRLKNKDFPEEEMERESAAVLPLTLSSCCVASSAITPGRRPDGGCDRLIRLAPLWTNDTGN